MDPHLESLLGVLVEQIRGRGAMHPCYMPQPSSWLTCSKVREPKVVVRYLPHKVEDLERVVTVLQEPPGTVHQDLQEPRPPLSDAAVLRHL